MKRLLTSAAAIAIMNGAAFAADLGVPEAAPIMAPVPVYNWTGFYIGAGAGWAWDDVDADFETAFGSGDASYTADGFLIGAQVGADWQWNWLVLGARADISWLDVDGDDGGEDGGVDSIDGNWLASFNLRAGVAFNRFLAYAIGGVAVVDYDYELTDLVAPFPDESDSQTDWGWDLGGGLEVAVTQNFSVWAEYRHFWIDGDDISFAGPGTLLPQTINADQDIDTVWAGVNWRF